MSHIHKRCTKLNVSQTVNSGWLLFFIEFSLLSWTNFVRDGYWRSKLCPNKPVYSIENCHEMFNHSMRALVVVVAAAAACWCSLYHFAIRALFCFVFRINFKWFVCEIILCFGFRNSHQICRCSFCFIHQRTNDKKKKKQHKHTNQMQLKFWKINRIENDSATQLLTTTKKKPKIKLK